MNMTPSNLQVQAREGGGGEWRRLLELEFDRGTNRYFPFVKERRLGQQRLIQSQDR